MKKLIALMALVAAMNASAFTNSDFDALEKKAYSSATAAAADYSRVLGVQVETVTERDNGAFSMVAKYDVTTNTNCTMVVKVGLGFRAKVTEAYDCE